MTITVQDVPAILKAHALWTKGEGGERANLSGAHLFGANLFGANLIDCGHRSDGYRFVGIMAADGTIMVQAGCRFFSLTDARRHWLATRPDTQLGKESLAFCDHIERMAGVLEWTAAGDGGCQTAEDAL